MNVKMESGTMDLQDKCKLYYKFTKVLTLKVAQIVVQSRQGKKITHECNAKFPENGVESSPQWFNLSIPDEPAVTEDTKRVLNGEVVAALAKVLCIEIALHTADGHDMVLELWTVRLAPGAEHGSPSAVYYRMSVMLKSTLTISRITPAYKLSRSQHDESYRISHKIYGGEPDREVLGERRRVIKVSELHTPIGTLTIEVVYRTELTVAPDAPAVAVGLASDAFHLDTSRRSRGERKELDLSKPLTAGAFVDEVQLRRLHAQLGARPASAPAPHSAPTPASHHLLQPEVAMPQPDGQSASCSRAVDVPRARDRRAGLMDFPFADGSPIAELASFYQECMAPAWDAAWEAREQAPGALARQLRAFEEQVPEFDEMLASMLSEDSR